MSGRKSVTDFACVKPSSSQTQLLTRRSPRAGGKLRRPFPVAPQVLAEGAAGLHLLQQVEAGFAGAIVPEGQSEPAWLASAAAADANAEGSAS